MKVVQKMEAPKLLNPCWRLLKGQKTRKDLKVKEAAEVTAAADEEEMKSPEEATTSAATVKPSPDAVKQENGADPDMGSSDIPTVDPAPEEAMHEEATTDEETGAEKAAPAEEGGHIIGWRGHRRRGSHFK